MARHVPRHLVNKKCQHVSKVYNPEITTLIEVVKYGSKIFTEPYVNVKAGQKTDCEIYAAALHNIFTDMKGFRIFERFGFNLPKTERESKTSVVSGAVKWMFEAKAFDWVNDDIDLLLSGYVPSQELINLLTYSINTHLE